MGGAALESIAAALIEGGRPADTPAVSVEWGTLPEQRSVTAPLGRIAAAAAAAGLRPPLITVVGAVASLGDHLRWFESRPLFGKRVLVTCTRQQASDLAALLRREGAIPVQLPALEIGPVFSAIDVKETLHTLSSGLYYFCIFTSVNAVEQLWRHIRDDRKDSRIFADCRVAAIGEATAAALWAHGIKLDLIPEDATSEGLLSELSHWGPAGERILLPKAVETRGVLLDGLQELGAKVDELVLYESALPQRVDPEALRLIRDGRIDIATFASSSSVRNLAALLGKDFARIKETTVACIGPVTAATAREMGLTVHVEPADHSIPALVAALRGYFSKSPPPEPARPE